MQADKVLYNGVVGTQGHTALAVSGERIVATGNDADMRNLLAADGEATDLGGRRVIPGLTDAHVHLQWYADMLDTVNLMDTQSREEIVEKMAARAADIPPGEWVRGRGWAQDDWADKAFPSTAQLDAALPDHPVYLTARSGHAAWVNSKAMQMAGITSDTPDPDGGEIVRDADGKPTGLLLEEALHIVRKAMPRPTPEQLADMIQEAIKAAHAVGLTGVHDFDGPECFEALQILKAQGGLTLRVVKNIPVSRIDHALRLGLRWGFGDDWLRIGGVKTFADGALGLRTASMLAAYENEPDNFGIVVTDKEVMVENIRRASEGGLPSTIHAIGDKAVHDVLDAYEIVRKDEAAWGIAPGQLRHRIEHVQIIHPDDVPRLAQLGLVASMQPIHATSDMLMADSYWGDRAAYSYAWRKQMDAGAAIAFGSDAPVEPINPLLGIHAAVTRRRKDGSPGPDGWRPDGNARLTVDEALRGFTEGPAYAAGLEDRLAQLAPGYLADVVVLDRDIYNVDPKEIADTKPAGVMVGGQWVIREL